MSANYKEGDKVCWRAVNGIQSGEIVKVYPSGYLVLLPNGKHSLVNERSFINGIRQD